MRRFLSVIMIFVLALSLASCSGGGEGETINYALDASPVTLDPQYAGDIGAKLVINNVFEGLVRLSENGEVIPGIAESWSVSPDGLTYTFKLKEGTEWRCTTAIRREFGQEFYDKFAKEKVTAHDFVFAMRRAVSPEIASPNAHRLFSIQNATEIYSGQADASSLGVTAPDDLTLIIKLKEPCADLLERLTESAFMPCNEEFFKATNGRYGLSYGHILCNGPFYVSAWDSESSLIIKKNADYAGENEVLPASVVFSFDSDSVSVARKLLAQSVSAALLPPYCETPEGSVVVKENANSVYGFVFNCADSILKNINVRKALCSSIDRGLFENGETAQSGFVPASCSAGSLNYRNAVGSQTPDIKFNKEAAASLWSAGLSELEMSKAAITVLCPEEFDSAVRRQLQIWQQTMGISLSVTVENKTPEEINSAVASGNFQLALTGIESPYDSAVDFLASFKGGSVFRFKSDEYDMIIDRLLMVEGESELLGGCFTAENYILQNALCYPLYSRTSRFVTAEDVEGVYMLDSENTVCFIGTKRYD